MDNLKKLSWVCVRDKRSPMSGRVYSLLIYVAIRAGEIIDWWFPVRHHHAPV